MKVAPPGGWISNKCIWRYLFTKFQAIRYLQLWCHLLDPLCLWQCFFSGLMILQLMFFFITKNSLKSNTEILFSFYISPLLWAYCCWPNCLLKLYDTSIFVQCTIQHNWYYLPVLGMITMFISMRTAMNIAFFTFHSYHGKSWWKGYLEASKYVLMCWIYRITSGQPPQCGVFNVICCIPWLYVFGDKICDSWCHMTWHDIGEMLKMVNRCCLQCLSACSLLESEVVGSPGLLLSAPAATSQLRLCHELKAPARAKAAPPPNLLSQPSLPPHTHWQSYFSPVN